ncbi:hypothetical protein DFAR_910009 [Desulfarculales bacterium]
MAYYPSVAMDLASLPFYVGLAELVGRATPAQHKLPSGPMLSEAVKTYLKAKTPNWSQASRNDIPSQVRQFVDTMAKAVADADIFITDLTREHIRDYCVMMHALPKRVNVPKYKGKGYAKRAKLNPPHQECLAPKTLATRLTKVSSFINWASKE